MHSNFYFLRRIFYFPPPHKFGRLTQLSPPSSLIIPPPLPSHCLHPSISIPRLPSHWPPLLSKRFGRGFESWETLSVTAPYAFPLNYSRNSTRTRFYWAVPMLAAGTDCSNCLTINSYFAVSLRQLHSCRGSKDNTKNFHLITNLKVRWHYIHLIKEL